MKISELEPNTPGMEEVGEKYRVEGGTINLSGLRLNPFDTADISVTLRADRAGVYMLQPRIYYLDERGRYQQYRPQPVTIVARGTSGEGGEREKSEAPKVEYEFEEERS